MRYKLEGLEPAVVELAAVDVVVEPPPAAADDAVVVSAAATSSGLSGDISGLSQPFVPPLQEAMVGGHESKYLSQDCAPEKSNRWDSVGRALLGVGGLILFSAGIIGILVVTKGIALPFVAKAMPWLAAEIVEPLACLVASGLCLGKAVKPGMLGRAWSWMRGRSAEVVADAGHSGSSVKAMISGSTTTMFQAPNVTGITSAMVPQGKTAHGLVIPRVDTKLSNQDGAENKGCMPWFGGKSFC